MSAPLTIWPDFDEDGENGRFCIGRAGDCLAVTCGDSGEKFAQELADAHNLTHAGHVAATVSAPRLYPVCECCGGRDVAADDSAARWDANTGQWVMSDPSTFHCDDCGETYVEIEWREADNVPV